MRLRYALPLAAALLAAACHPYVIKDKFLNRSLRIRRRSAVVNPFGANSIATHEQAGARRYELQTRLAGIGWTREVFPWGKMEPEFQKRDWSFTNGILEQTEALGVRLLPVIDQCATWARYDFLAESADKAIQVPNIYHWRNHVRMTVGRYKDKVEFWEIWNRPDDPAHFAGQHQDYVRLLKAAYSAARGADPNCVVLMGTVADADWLDRVLKLGAANYCDIICLALTAADTRPTTTILTERKPPDTEPVGDNRKAGRMPELSAKPYSEARELMGIKDQLGRFKVVLENHQVNKPFWVTSAAMRPAPARLQARFLVKLYTTAMAYGANCVFCEDFVSHLNGGVAEGLLYPDLSRRPAAEAHALLSKLLAHVVSGRVIADNPGGLTHYEFKALDEIIQVAWSAGESAAPLPLGYKRVYDMHGEIRPLTVGEEKTGELIVRKEPVFITAEIIEQPAWDPYTRELP